MTLYDPNLFTSLARGYMGGVTLPKPHEAGYRVFVDDDGSNFRYSPGEVDSLPAFSIANALQGLRVNVDGTGSEWHTFEPADIGAASDADLVAAEAAASAALAAHADNVANPHAVTAAQAGALPLTGGTLTGKVEGPNFVGTPTTSILVGGTATITSCNVRLDTEGEAATDDWDGVLFGPEVPDGSIILVRTTNSSRDVTIKQSGTPTTGSGKIYTWTGRDIGLLASFPEAVLCARVATHLVVLGGLADGWSAPAIKVASLDASGAVTAASVAATGAVSGASFGPAATTATISGGAITVTSAYVTVDTEGAAATDDLTTINFGANVPVGALFLLRTTSVARDVVLKHAVGDSITVTTGRDLTLGLAGSSIALMVRIGTANSVCFGALNGNSLTLSNTFPVVNLDASGAVTAASVAATGALSTAARVAITASAVPATPATGVALYWTGTALAFKDSAGVVHTITDTV